MKRLFRRVLLAVLPALMAATLRAGGFTYYSPSEAFLTADLDGDGRTDTVIVDRGSGVYRVGYGAGPGDGWVPARASGAEDVASAGAGRLLALDRDALVFASIGANHVNIVAAEDPAATGIPRPLFTPGIGPVAAVPIDIGGPGNTAHDDLFVATSGLEPVTGLRRVSVRAAAGAFTVLADVPGQPALADANPVRLKSGGPQYLAAVESGPGGAAFKLFSLLSGSPAQVVDAGTPPGQSYVAGIFGGGTLARFLFYTRNATRFLVRPVTEPSPGVFSFGSPTTNQLAQRITQIVVLESTPPRLLVLGPLDTPARVFDFDGTNAPILSGEFQTPEGYEFYGAVPLPDGGFRLFSGIQGSGHSSSYWSFRTQGTGYADNGSGELPGRNVIGTHANVFLFAEEPFVSLAPRLVASLNAPDWSRSANLGGPSVAVQAERYAGPAQGVDNPGVRNLGPRPAAAIFGLVNQHRDPISVAAFQPAAGDEVEDVTISPPPGPQTRAITVTVRSVGDALVSFRTSTSSVWRTRTNTASFLLYRDTEVSYFARPFSGDRKGRIRKARYTFPGPPESQDSDGDGVPDFVEIARGLDPNGGADSDGDGLSDLSELISGLDPYNPGCTNCPETNIVGRAVVENAAFDLYVSPRPLDGTTGAEAPPRTRQRVLLHDLAGSVLDQAATRAHPAALFNPSARFTNAPAETTRFLLAAATDPNFDIATAAADPAIGRELLALVAVPGLERPAFDFTPGPSDLSLQVGAWIAAASNFQASVVRPQVRVRADVASTLVALLVERKMDQLLAARGEPGFGPTNLLSLFSFRFADAGMTPPTIAALGRLERLGSSGEPAWKITSVHADISNAVVSAEGAPLRSLAERTYLLSSRSNNVVPGRFPQPVDALRAFVRTGQIHSNYVTHAPLTPGMLSAAATSVSQLLAASRARPTNLFVLEVLSDSFQPGCTRLRVVSGPLAAGTPVNLFAAPRTPYKFPDAFTLIPGSRVSAAAFTDFTDPCPGDDLEVFHAELLSVPAAAISDANSNLLPDDWENLFFGGAGIAGADVDFDGYSNLQEYLDGSDPGDALSRGAVAYDLSMPPLAIEAGGGGAVKVKFSFPAAYSGRFRFRLYAATDLAAGFAEVEAEQTQAGDRYELNLPSFPSEGGFFYVTQSLRH